MGVKIKVPRAVQIRRLQASGLEPDDIVKLTGWAPAIVREALRAGAKGAAIKK